MILLDNIIFELQKHGGISNYWIAVLIEAIKEENLTIHFLQSSKVDRWDIPINKQANEKNIPLLLRRYIDVNTPNCNIFHSSYLRIHKNPKVKNIVTIHDFIQEKFDTGLRQKIHIAQKKHAIKNASKIICVSHNTKNDLINYYPGVNPTDIEVIYNGVDNNIFKPIKNLPLNENKPKLIYIGSRAIHKNFKTALQAICTKEAKKIGLQLLLIGGGELTKAEKENIKANKIESKIELKLGLSNQEINYYLNTAFAFIYPSLYEGFGIPPLEAMSAGCPVICSNAASLPEVVGDASLLFNPNDSDMFDVYISKLQDSAFRNELIEKGAAQARKFSWEKTGRETVQIYKSML